MSGQSIATTEEQAALAQALERVARLEHALRTVATYAEGRQHMHAAMSDVGDADAALGFGRLLALAGGALGAA